MKVRLTGGRGDGVELETQSRRIEYPYMEPHAKGEWKIDIYEQAGQTEFMFTGTREIARAELNPDGTLALPDSCTLNKVTD